jgi:hypothetical protein
MITILEAIANKKLFEPWFKGETWEPWFAFLSALFGLPMTNEQSEIYKRHTGRAMLPIDPAKEAWLVVGRRGGKSLIAALVAVFLACFRDWSKCLVPGERGTVMIIAADRRQARVVLRYIKAFLEIPTLKRMVENVTTEAVDLTNRISIEVHTASFRSTRGYSIVAAICDEIAYWRSEESANPDVEIISSIRPGMATTGGLLLCISSPYARRGALWEAYRKHFAEDGDPILIWQADTRSMNPSVPEHVIAAAYQDDPSSAAAEYGAQFRTDIETYVNAENVSRCVIPGRTSLEPAMSLQYSAFVDVAGGSGQDSFSWAVSHCHGYTRRNAEEEAYLPTRCRVELQDEANKLRREAKARGTVVLDLLCEVKPPFSPEATVERCAADLKRYQIRQVTGDRYAGEWPREIFRKFGIEYRVSDQSKSEIYQSFLPLLNSGKVELPDDRRLVSQLCGLERRTARGGRDSIDHGPNAHDDVANAGAGAIVLASESVSRGGGSMQPITWVG